MSPFLRSVGLAGVVFFSQAGLACGGVLDVGSNEKGAGAPADDGTIMPGTITGSFVVIGDGLVVSENAREWRSARSPAPRLRAVAAEGSMLVVIDGAGRSYVLNDQASTWSARALALPLEDEQAIALAWDGAQFVAGSGGWSGAASAVSTDGLTWTSIAAPQNHMFDLAFRTPAGARVASHYLSDLMTPGIWELKGGAWQPSSTPRFTGSRPEGLMAAAYAPEVSRTFGVAGTVVFDTADGETWSSHEVSGLDGFRLRAVAAGGGRIVTIGETGGSWASNDRGATWARGNVEGEGFYASLAYGNGLFVAVGRTPVAVESKGVVGGAERTADGVTWRREVLPSMISPAGIVFVRR